MLPVVAIDDTWSSADEAILESVGLRVWSAAFGGL
jgi:hypothetical protein